MKARMYAIGIWTGCAMTYVVSVLFGYQKAREVDIGMAIYFLGLIVGITVLEKFEKINR